MTETTRVLKEHDLYPNMFSKAVSRHLWNTQFVPGVAQS